MAKWHDLDRGIFFRRKIPIDIENDLFLLLPLRVTLLHSSVISLVSIAFSWSSVPPKNKQNTNV